MPSAVITVTQSWNRYSYAANNPMRHNDLSGELPMNFTAEQTRLFDTYVAQYNKDQNSSYTAQRVWDKLTDSQQTTFKSDLTRRGTFGHNAKYRFLLLGYDHREIYYVTKARRHHKRQCKVSDI
jgi:hypothetical protein